MKWVADITQPKSIHFEIWHDQKAGYYLYVWENNKGKYDYLQDTLESAQRFALIKFQVSMDAWKQEE